ncbi:MAG TPA: L-rhamnose/proton symporter RhaT [Candidatus Acidoferrum sp.]|nr:L-rhamnose/proton symporter RhaT [Candidatus Acidoferrum sp.]
MLAALLLVLLAGGMNGSFAAPMKRIRGWDWEHSWFAWSVLGMILIPWIVASVTIPNLHSVYRGSGFQSLAFTVFFGLIWGAGTVLFGLGITRIGLALGFGIILGTSSALGTLIPLVVLHRELLFMTSGVLLMAGVAVIVAGVAACARAGLLREASAPQLSAGSSFLSGLGICLLSGLGSTSMSFALNEATPISKAAESLGASPASSMNAVWPVLLAGGFAANAGYCAWLIVRRKRIGQFRQATAVNLGLVAVMALLWSGSDFVYTSGAHGLGPLGLLVGWPVFMASIVLTANAWGFLTGEWRNAGVRAISWAMGGCALLIAGIWVVALAGSQSA